MLTGYKSPEKKSRIYRWSLSLPETVLPVPELSAIVPFREAGVFPGVEGILLPVLEVAGVLPGREAGVLPSLSAGREAGVLAGVVVVVEEAVATAGVLAGILEERLEAARLHPFSDGALFCESIGRVPRDGTAVTEGDWVGSSSWE